MRLSPIQRELIFEVAHQLTGSSRTFRAEVVVHNVAARMRACGIASLTDYFEFALEDRAELHELISAMTIHTTQWFRDPAQLTELEVHLEKIIESRARGCTLRLLSAGCSSGQEVYTLALICERIRSRHPNHFLDYEVVGCDIDPVHLQIGRVGQYHSRAGMDAFSEQDLSWIEHVPAATGDADRSGLFEVKAGLKSKTSFKTSNLLKTDAYLLGQFDVCVCRNVLIYFDPEGVQSILGNLLRYLLPKSLLVLGAGEAVSLPFSGTSSIGHGIFRVEAEKTPVVAAKETRWAPEPEIFRRSLKLVAVDDDEDMLEVYKEYCAAINSESHSGDLDLRTFSDPQSALSYLRTAAGSAAVVFIDFEMPLVNGAQFLAEVRRFDTKIACVLVSGHGGRSTFSKASGFDDMLAKPLDMASFEKCIRLLAGNVTKSSQSARSAPPDAILIGASTGGPPLLESLLRNSSPHTPPILVVQHISAAFSASLAAQLRESSRLTLGRIDGVTPLRQGHLYVSFSQEHLVVGVHNGNLVAKSGGRAPVHGQCPAVDPLFQSAAAAEGKFHFWAGLFTGMGKDGGLGMLKLMEAGGWTFVQDETSSVVYGMPKFAKELGAACSEGPPEKFRNSLEAVLQLGHQSKAS